MTFPRDAISEPTLIVVHRWKSRACSPQLQDNEAVVSNVIEFSTGSDEALEFKADVKLVLSHSAPNLHGYELVVFKLTDRETNEWENVAGIENFWSLSGKLSTVLFRSMLWRHVGRMVEWSNGWCVGCCTYVLVVESSSFSQFAYWQSVGHPFQTMLFCLPYFKLWGGAVA